MPPDLWRDRGAGASAGTGPSGDRGGCHGNNSSQRRFRAFCLLQCPPPPPAVGPAYVLSAIPTSAPSSFSHGGGVTPRFVASHQIHSTSRVGPPWSGGRKAHLREAASEAVVASATAAAVAATTDGNMQTLDGHTSPGRDGRPHAAPQCRHSACWRACGCLSGGGEGGAYRAKCTSDVGRHPHRPAVPGVEDGCHSVPPPLPPIRPGEG